MSHKFDPKEIEKLNNPERFKFQDPKQLADLIQKINVKVEVVVDLGAGTGVMIDKISSFLPNVKKVVGLDVEPMMIEWMKTHGPKTVTPTLMTESKIPLIDQSSDLVTMINLFHELESTDQILNEVSRVLKNRSAVVIVDWAKKVTPKGPPIDHRIAEEVVVKSLQQAGFTQIKNHPIYEWHYVITAIKE
jgi:ubiquinone/menaquinone biosynthesis C-methylase UbiE